MKTRMILSVFPSASRLVCILVGFHQPFSFYYTLLYSRLPLNHCCESWKEKRSLIVARCLPRWQSSLKLFLLDDLSLSVRLEWTLCWNDPAPVPCPASISLNEPWRSTNYHIHQSPLCDSQLSGYCYRFPAMAGEAMSTFCIPENDWSSNLAEGSHPQTHKGISVCSLSLSLHMNLFCSGI